MQRSIRSFLIPSLAFVAACAVQQPTPTTDSQHVAVCQGGTWRCFSRSQADSAGLVHPHTTPQGWGAADLASAYKIPTTTDPHATIAIIGAYGYSNLASDLAQYRTTMGLGACTVAS